MTPENIWGIRQLNSCQKRCEPVDDDITTAVHTHTSTSISHFYQSLLYFKLFLFGDQKGQKPELFACHVNKTLWQSQSGLWVRPLHRSIWARRKMALCWREGRAHPFCRERKDTSNDLIVPGRLRLPATTGFP